jgi:hypothetical protein
MMRSFLVFLTAVAACAVTSSALAVGEPTKRRDVLASLVLGGSLAGAIPDARAIDVSSIAAPPLSAKSVFLGTYTDPVNHPGGTRTIELSGVGFAGYELATVKGGGGNGEPASFELPAMVFNCPGNAQQGGKYCITIDFSPKGGPKDFQGYWDEDKKGIRFVLDNNFWPMK